MVDWTAPSELAIEGAAFTKFMHALIGLYAWEFCTSLDFEWDFISGKKKFRWPLIFYFAGRYCLLFAMIGIAIALDTTTQINCQALYTFNQLFGDAAVGLASINLSIRTIAVWSQNRWVVLGLVAIILGHWSLILQGVLLKAVWVPNEGCVITHTSNTTLAATFIYSMAFDLIVLLLNAYKLVGRPNTDLPPKPPTIQVNKGNNKKLMSVSSGDATQSSWEKPFDGGKSQPQQQRKKLMPRVGGGVGGWGGSRLGRLVFGDGLIFFLIAFLSNLLATVFMLLNLNAIMSVIFNVPAAVASTIVACRAVRRLTNFSNQRAELYDNHAHSNINFRTTRGGGAAAGVGTGMGTRSGVHVQMETFTRAEDPTEQDIDTYKRFEAEAEATHAAHVHLSGIGMRPESQSSTTDVDLDLDLDEPGRGVVVGDLEKGTTTRGLNINVREY